MRVWVLCVVVFFGAAELYQWIEGLSLPMPVLIAAGALLAVVSNSNRWPALPGQPNSKPIAPPASEQVIDVAAVPAPSADRADNSSAPAQRHYPGPQLPNLIPPGQSISFTVRKPK